MNDKCEFCINYKYNCQYECFNFKGICENYKDKPAIHSRWNRANYDPSKGRYNGYTIRIITNTEHRSNKHPPQVIYQGDNGYWWSLPLSEWPGNLIKEREIYSLI